MLTHFSIETTRIRCIWRRTRERAGPGDPAKAPLPPTVHVESDGAPPRITLFDPDGARLIEQADYVLFVEHTGGGRVRVRHEDPVVLARLHTAAGGRVVHGLVNFGAQVGRSRFYVDVDDRPHCWFEVEVVPSKLDYERDFEVICDDLQELAAGLILEYLRPTFTSATEQVFPAPSSTAVSSTTAWLFVLEQSLDELERAVAYVARHPRRRTVPVAHPLRVEAIRRPDAALVQAVRHGRGTGDWHALGGGGRLRAVVPASPMRYTLDTPEHRWLAAQLAAVGRRLAEAAADERRLPDTARRRYVLDRLETLARRIAVLQRRIPLRDAPEAERVPDPPTRLLLRAPGYREAYRALMRLRRGLRLRGEALRVRLKDLHLLYEYWCFLTLVRLAAEATHRSLPARQLLRVEHTGLRLRLRRGTTHRVRWALDDGRRLAITYNPRFGGRGYLVAQQPDLLLSIHEADGTTRRYVLDAKYRLDDSAGYRRRYGIPGPPVDALNVLHRYRDAIRSRQGGAGRPRLIHEAVALYPYREERPGAYAASRLGQALGDVGIGAIPLLPGATESLTAWLRDRIGASE